jgi:hypothetical protein
MSHTMSPFYDAEHVAKLFQCSLFKPPPVVGYLTFFDLGWSILRLRDFARGKWSVFSPQQWYTDEEFARREEPPCYRLLRLEPVQDSFEKTFADQASLLRPEDEVPSARVLIAGMLTHFLASGQRLFETCYVRSIDKSAAGDHVGVGYFAAGGLNVDNYWNDKRNGHVGLAAARKFLSLAPGSP